MINSEQRIPSIVDMSSVPCTPIIIQVFQHTKYRKIVSILSILGILRRILSFLSILSILSISNILSSLGILSIPSILNNIFLQENLKNLQIICIFPNKITESIWYTRCRFFAQIIPQHLVEWTRPAKTSALFLGAEAPRKQRARHRGGASRRRDSSSKDWRQRRRDIRRPGV